jgi:uncharacterized membrane protein
MTKNRVEAFTDAIIAIIITILVLEFPHVKGNHFADLLVLKEIFLAYLMSFIFLIIYWHNHHHMFQMIDLIDGQILWLNNLFVFLLTLLPFTTSWLGDNIWARDPELLYAILFFGANIAWLMMAKHLVKVNRHKPDVADILGDYKKSYVTLLLNVLALLVAIFIPISGLLVNALSFLFWLLPDKRIEKLKNRKID